MLLRITNRCHSGCSHCMIDASGPEGEHMTEETFVDAARFVLKAKIPVLLVSGGEPFEHPQVFEMAKVLEQVAPMVTYISNGHFALDDEKAETIKKMGLKVQVTCDPRFYPRILMRERFMDNPNIYYEDRLRVIFPCRRTREAGIPYTRFSPGCFNLRSATRSHGFTVGSTLLIQQGKMCAPSINVDGSIRAGEIDTCHQIGTVKSAVWEVEENIRNMRCGLCGLGADLSKMHLDAIGGSV